MAWRTCGNALSQYPINTSMGCWLSVINYDCEKTNPPVTKKPTVCRPPERSHVFFCLIQYVYCVNWCVCHCDVFKSLNRLRGCCPACRTYEIACSSLDVVICPIYMCLTVYEFSLILFDFCLFITIFIFILNYVLVVTRWIFTYHKILILLNIYCFIWNYWIIYFVTCLEVFWSVMS